MSHTSELILLFRRIRRGIWFDAAIFLANCWLVPRLTELSAEDGDISAPYAAALLLSLLLYVLGAGLKRRPLQSRLAQTQRPPTATWAWIALFVLVIMQFALGIFIFMMATETLGKYCVWMPSGESAYMLGLALAAATVLVFMTIRALVPPSGRLVEDPPPALRRQELFADHALYFSAVVSLSIWDGMFMSDLAGRGPYPWYLAILLITLITVPFAMFYAAPRILFLAEDYRRPSTWLRLAAVMLPLSLRLLQSPP